ncbi:YrrS family protein [Sporosarcina siberiensis]|uniref:YrrS family protein n=1 Tax=Sporosarcina siberiensis TaxID=1365606 RepID=A0ABW4SEY2_9BACL
MKNREPDFSRYGRKKNRNRMNKVLNVLIGVVVLLIVVISVVIFSGNGDDKIADGNKGIETEKDAAKDDDSKVDLEEDSTEEEDSTSEDTTDSDKATENKDGKTDGIELGKAEDDKDTNATEEPEEEIDDSTSDTIVVTEPTSDKEFVSETIVDSAWKPIATEQSGEHVSSYDGESVDWHEKKKAIAYAIGQSEDELIFWKVKNGGNPQKSIGIIESKTDSSKYRVYIEWVNNEGWKPVKKDVLKSLDFDY